MGLVRISQEVDLRLIVSCHDMRAGYQKCGVVPKCEYKRGSRSAVRRVLRRYLPLLTRPEHIVHFFRDVHGQGHQPASGLLHQPD
jgi:hypothetical protein